jgi:pyruvate formate lyase activating enzyme
MPGLSVLMPTAGGSPEEPGTARYWHAAEDGAVVCELCPHHCRIAEGRFGLCKVRQCVAGALELPYFGQVSALAMDPIEKKPLFHFMPGSMVFSAGFVGCNMRCPFCQNWQISQTLPPELESYTPRSLAAAALESGCPSIAYTYSEPCVHFEFVLAAMAAARTVGLKNVLVTNGCLESSPARELLSLTDAVNVDLKSWSDEAYANSLGGDRNSVLEFIRIAFSLCRLEVTTLVVPGISDSREGIGGIAGFLSSLSADIPLHISAYHPDWKYEASPNEPKLLGEIVGLAKERLRYVYLGNVAGIGADTRCPSCGSTAISRRGYRIAKKGIRGTGPFAACAACGYPLPIFL